MSIKCIGNLWLEVTRRCNMSCPHCCRGEAQDINMDCMALLGLLEQVSSVGMLGFTGGEPTLVPDKMLEILRMFKNLNTPVSTLEMVTNGKELTAHFIYAWAAWLDYCNYPDNAQVYISIDQFHEEIDVRHYEDMLNCEVTLRGLDQVFAEGRKQFDTTLPKIEIQQIKIENNSIIDPIYLNCIGDLLPGVDWSYNSQIYKKICSIDSVDVMKEINSWGV